MALYLAISAEEYPKILMEKKIVHTNFFLRRGAEGPHVSLTIRPFKIKQPLSYVYEPESYGHYMRPISCKASWGFNIYCVGLTNQAQTKLVV